MKAFDLAGMKMTIMGAAVMISGAILDGYPLFLYGGLVLMAVGFIFEDRITIEGVDKHDTH